MTLTALERRNRRIRIAREEQTRLGGYREAAPTTPRLTISWSSLNAFSVIICVLLVWPLMAVAATSLAAFALPLGVLPIAAAVYVTLALTANRVTVSVTNGLIRSELRPFPIWPTKTLSAERVLHVTATQSVEDATSSESTSLSWYVVAHSNDGPVVLTQLLRKREEAILVARTVEDHLGLQKSNAPDALRC